MTKKKRKIVPVVFSSITLYKNEDANNIRHWCTVINQKHFFLCCLYTQRLLLYMHARFLSSPAHTLCWCAYFLIFFLCYLLCSPQLKKPSFLLREKFIQLNMYIMFHAHNEDSCPIYIYIYIYIKNIIPPLMCIYKYLIYLWRAQIKDCRWNYLSFFFFFCNFICGGCGIFF